MPLLYCIADASSILSEQTKSKYITNTYIRTAQKELYGFLEKHFIFLKYCRGSILRNFDGCRRLSGRVRQFFTTYLLPLYRIKTLYRRV